MLPYWPGTHRFKGTRARPFESRPRSRGIKLGLANEQPESSKHKTRTNKTRTNKQRESKLSSTAFLVRKSWKNRRKRDIDQINAILRTTPAQAPGAEAQPTPGGPGGMMRMPGMMWDHPGMMGGHPEIMGNDGARLRAPRLRDGANNFQSDGR